MVRFIINRIFTTTKIRKRIYIPLWLDLLLLQTSETTNQEPYLHSTMVRFIILESEGRVANTTDLHSTMVRFIISGLNPLSADATGFTFHYG